MTTICSGSSVFKMYAMKVRFPRFFSHRKWNFTAAVSPWSRITVQWKRSNTTFYALTFAGPLRRSRTPRLSDSGFQYPPLGPGNVKHRKSCLIPTYILIYYMSKLNKASLFDASIMSYDKWATSCENLFMPHANNKSADQGYEDRVSSE